MKHFIHWFIRKLMQNSQAKKARRQAIESLFHDVSQTGGRPVRFVHRPPEPNHSSYRPKNW